MQLDFKLEATTDGTHARATRFRLPAGEIRTPLFMPVGTQATVRNQTLETLENSGAQILLANTYHLMQRPGPEVFKKLGGIHKFMKWKGSVLTDSGGFQVFSLSDKTRIDEEGVTFKPHPDSAPIFLSPERSIEMQAAIGSDIRMVFDQCVNSTSDHAFAREAMERTHRWATRSLEAHKQHPGATLFGIVQGACFEDLRRESAAVLTAQEFGGFAIGGLAVGETKSQREDFTELTASLLPKDKPRYLMGVGTPIDLLEAVHRGVDLFDCILPVSLAQQGVAWTSVGRIDLRRTAYRFTDERLDPDCACPTCALHSRAYLHHLIKAREPFGWQLIGAHNLWFYQSLMREMRTSILENRFAELYREKRETLQAKDDSAPIRAPKPGRKRPTRLGDYEVVATESGYGRIRQISSGETMHSVSEPLDEARRLYVEQPEVAERLCETSDEPLRIWDVGLGAGANLMAVVEAAEALGERQRRPLEIISFENDLNSLRLALKHEDLFRYLRHAAPATLLEKGEWQSKNGMIRCRLLNGDFLSLMASAPPADLIFFDPFSFKADSPLWSTESFAQIARACDARATELYTYSASTAVRARMLEAGWWVAQGYPSGPKEQTTIALTFRATGAGGWNLLGSEWLQRWKRSHVFHPVQDQVIHAHPQFLPTKNVDRETSSNAVGKRSSVLGQTDRV